MQGHRENEQATQDAFCDGWIRSGDVGLLDEDGYLYIVDRIKDIIIVGSSNLYPSDLEAVLDDCSEIREAAVLGRPDTLSGQPSPAELLFLGTHPEITYDSRGS